MPQRAPSSPALTRRRAVRAAGLAALAGSVAVSAAVAQAPAAPDPWVIGVWRTRRTPGPNRPDVHQIDVFIPGGVYLCLDSPVERTADLRDFPDAIEYAGPFAGQWLMLPSGEVRVTAIQLNYDRTPTLWTEERYSLTFRYDAATDTMVGDYDWRESALDGTLILSARGTSESERVTVRT